MKLQNIRLLKTTTDKKYDYFNVLDENQLFSSFHS